MLRKKYYNPAGRFWLVWLVLCPFVFCFYAFRASYSYHLNGMAIFKTGLVRRAVYEKMVLQKETKRTTLRQYGYK